MKDYGPVVVEQHPVLRAPGNRPGQDLRLDVTAGLAGAVGRAAAEVSRRLGWTEARASRVS